MDIHLVNYTVGVTLHYVVSSTKIYSKQICFVMFTHANATSLLSIGMIHKYEYAKCFFLVHSLTLLAMCADAPAFNSSPTSSSFPDDAANISAVPFCFQVNMWRLLSVRVSHREAHPQENEIVELLNQCRLEHKIVESTLAFQVALNMCRLQYTRMHSTV